ncbi:histone-lysine N-methyltransferase EHMT2-like isoform X1 [Rhineura floridana]|uniref:histone-lysine N-methyltransferase EHMT2-like isoform X1 n=1 Tax=Rhineura floridana TaxID=261503 RepID=UPI002AC85622|nr:histone-lysine N-methyltransferase EHMT2-like isoform X1 [Rhineura floridana]
MTDEGGRTTAPHLKKTATPSKRLSFVTESDAPKGTGNTHRDKEENICLHWASFTGSAEIAEVPLNAKCDLHAVNFHGDSPLHIAARESYDKCVLLFLSREADTEVWNKEGDSPVDLTLENSEVWFALQLNRSVHIEHISSRPTGTCYGGRWNRQGLAICGIVSDG